MAKVFAKVATSASIESRYVEGKARGFKHNPEVHDQLAILKIQREEVSALKKVFKAMTICYKNMAALREKASKDYLFFITEGRQNPKLGTVYNMFADYLTKTGEIWQTCFTHFNDIMEEWKLLSKTDLKNIESRLEHANKALVTRQYYELNKDHHNAKDWDQKYGNFITEFVKLLHELREKKETLHPQYVLRSLQAEMMALRALIVQSDQCAAALLNFGPVDPIKLSETFRLIARDPYPMSEEEKKKLHAASSSNPYAQPSGGNPYAQHSPAPQSTPQMVVVQTTYQQPLPPQLPPQVPQAPMCRGLYQFNGSTAQELSFNVGDVMRLLNTDGQWWQAELNGRTGMIPSNYVQRI